MIYFTINEFLASDTAARKKIDNTPPIDVIKHIEDLVDIILDPLREAWGGPLRVTSGYRCPELNKSVGGSKTSSHMTGYAADIQPVDVCRTASFITFANGWLREHNISFDQCIDETQGSTKWLHISLKNAAGNQRKQFLTINK